MKYAKILCGALLGLVVVNAMADEYDGPRNRCNAKTDKLWIEDTKACIPANPCSSDDRDIVDTYCVRRFADIDIDVSPMSARAHNANDSCAFYDVYEGSNWQYNQASDKCSGLNKNEWSAKFFYGTVKGNSLCTVSKGQERYASGSPKTEGTGNAKNCWCQPTEFEMADGNVQYLSPSGWVFTVDLNGNDVCEEVCAAYCGRRVTDEQDARKAFFELAQ